MLSPDRSPKDFLALLNADEHPRFVSATGAVGAALPAVYAAKRALGLKLPAHPRLKLNRNGFCWVPKCQALEEGRRGS